MSRKPKVHQAISSSVAKQIDENLKHIYAPTLQEEIPDHLQALLMQLRDRNTSQ